VQIRQTGDNREVMPMSGAWHTRLQVGLVIALFLGSLCALLYNAFTAAALPQRELQVRALLREASRLMAHSADALIRPFSGKDTTQLAELHRTLLAITNQALASFPGVEGGFYLSEVDQFSGYGFPTSRKDL